MMKSFDRSGEETVHTGPYGALPILIFPHDPAKAVLDGYPVDVEKAAGETAGTVRSFTNAHEGRASYRKSRLQELHSKRQSTACLKSSRYGRKAPTSRWHTGRRGAEPA